MQIKDIKLGEEYAECRYDPNYSFAKKRVRVLEILKVEEKQRRSWQQPKTVTRVKVLDIEAKGISKKTRLVPSRQIRWTWVEEEERQKAHREQEKALRLREKALDEARRNLEAALQDAGLTEHIYVYQHGRGIEVRISEPDAAKTLADKLLASLKVKS